MSLIHKDSCACTQAELDLKSVPPTQTGIVKGHYVEHGPIATLTDSGPIEFNITADGSEYLDFFNTYLYVACKIVKADGTDLGNDANVGPCNLFLHSLFSQVDLSLNDSLVTPSTSTYAYRAYLETLLSYGPAAKESQLTAALWYKDTAGHMDALDDNEGLTKRKNHTNRSAVVEMTGKLHLDLFFQDRYILNKVAAKLRLVRSKDAFCLMSDGTEYKVHLVDVALFVYKVNVNESIALQHAKLMERGNMNYPIRRVNTKVFTISRGDMTHTQENLFLGQLPKRIVLGCIDNAAGNGSWKLNPFNFNHFNLNYLSLKVDGNPIPAKPLTPDFARNKYIRSFYSLFAGIGKANSDEGNHISRDDYGKGYTLFAFDLTPDLQEDGFFEIVKRGTVRLEMHFAEPLPKTISVVVYAEFDNLLEITRERSILFDYTA